MRAPAAISGCAAIAGLRWFPYHAEIAAHLRNGPGEPFGTVRGEAGQHPMPLSVRTPKHGKNTEITICNERRSGRQPVD